METECPLLRHIALYYVLLVFDQQKPGSKPVNCDLRAESNVFIP